jgi:hypothetical protein
MTNYSDTEAEQSAERPEPLYRVVTEVTATDGRKTLFKGGPLSRSLAEAWADEPQRKDCRAWIEPADADAGQG